MIEKNTSQPKICVSKSLTYLLLISLFLLGFVIFTSSLTEKKTSTSTRAGFTGISLQAGASPTDCRQQFENMVSGKIGVGNLSYELRTFEDDFINGPNGYTESLGNNILSCPAGTKNIYGAFLNGNGTYQVCCLNEISATNRHLDEAMNATGMCYKQGMFSLWGGLSTSGCPSTIKKCTNYGVNPPLMDTCGRSYPQACTTSTIPNGEQLITVNCNPALDDKQTCTWSNTPCNPKEVLTTAPVIAPSAAAINAAYTPNDSSKTNTGVLTNVSTIMNTEPWKITNDTNNPTNNVLDCPTGTSSRCALRGSLPGIPVDVLAQYTPNEFCNRILSGLVANYLAGDGVNTVHTCQAYSSTGYMGKGVCCGKE